MSLKLTQKGRILAVTFCRRISGSSGTQEEGDSFTAWGSEGLMEDENSMHCCSGETRITGRRRWCTLEMIVCFASATEPVLSQNGLYNR